jgi:hypothetical protein
VKQNQHVIPHDRGWAVRGEGRKRVTSIHPTQRKAIEAARLAARNHGGELFVHDRSGRSRRRDTTGGNDPSPPKG